jgi:hypothetical protein
MLDERQIQCPYCWEYFEIMVDASEGDDQSFVYDCEVCCRPIDVQVRIQGESIKIRTKQDGSV